MEKTAIYFKGEWYIPNGHTDFRGPNGKPLENREQFLKMPLEEIQQGDGDIRRRVLTNNCIFEVIGFEAPRIGPEAFGEKTYYYGITTPEQQQENRERMFNDISKVFADKFKQYADGTRKR